MPIDLIQQEILLVINTSLTKKLLQKDTCDEKLPYILVEYLEDACWSGMIKDMLSGIIDGNHDNKVFLWHVKHVDNCLEMELGEYPGGKSDVFYTINPRNFLVFKNLN